MSNATITKPKSKKAKTKRKVSLKPTSEPENKSASATITNPETKTLGSSAPCENCGVKTNPVKETSKKKKKPMFKLGCWSGLFKGTPDF